MKIFLYIRVISCFLFIFESLEFPCLLGQAGVIDKYLKPIELTHFNSSIYPIDCIYIINLDARKDRWERIESACNQFFLLPNRVSAVDGWALSEEAKQELAFPYPCRLRGGQLGCLLSHISVLKDASQRDFDLIWVMEDDVEFVKDPWHLTLPLNDLTNWDPDWDVFYTDSDFRDKGNGYARSLSSDFRPDLESESLLYYLERIQIDRNIMQIRSRFGTYSMLISKKGIKKILDFYYSHPVWTAIDIDLHYIPGIREYASRQDIVSNLRDSPSDTEEERN